MPGILYDLPHYDLVNEEQLEIIHQASLRILREVGIKFLDDEVCEILKVGGAEEHGEVFRFDPELVESLIAQTPAQFIQQARNPQNNVIIGGNQMVFAPVYGPPFVLDRSGGRRRSTLEDFQNFVRLAYLSPWIHHSGGTVVEPNDIPEDVRHLDMIFSHIKYSDKPFMGSVMGQRNAEDSVALVKLLFGADAIREQPVLLSLINVNSPRLYDERMLGALKVYARNRQGLIITPFVFCGAMAPVTLAGSLAQQNAEVLAGVALTQMIEPGTPVVYGSFLTNLDLRNGSPTFGSPESQLGLFASAQLARRYRMPFRSGGMFTSSKIPDSQSAYESTMIMSATILARTNFVLHAAGWLEGGLVAGYEKFVSDCEILGMAHTWAKGIDLSEESLAFEAISEVEPAGHHLGTEHTIERFREAFYESNLFDNTHFEVWEEQGSHDCYTRASKKVETLLEEYQPPELDSAVEQALLDYMEKRKETILG